MRISYWSSDVCSSDLHDTGGGAGHVVLVGAEQPRMLGGLAADQGATGLDTGLGDALHDRGDALRHDPARGDVVGQEERLGAADDEVRSEEHTSELQSLMRISYAVFSLKKKKKDT